MSRSRAIDHGLRRATGAALFAFTARDGGPSPGLIVHHDDAEREYAYDRASSVGRLDRALEEAPQRDWGVISMGRDWRQVFADPGR